MKTRQKQVFTPIHERADHKHRIVVLNPDGTNEVGEWFETTEVATFKNLYASYGDDALPAGVFTSRELPVMEGADIRVASGPVAPHHAERTAAAGDRGVWLVGGGQLAAQFAAEGLIDELILTVVPVVLGSGLPTFAERLREAGFEVLNEVVLNQVLVSFGSAEETRRVIAEVQNEGTCWCGGTEWRGGGGRGNSGFRWGTNGDDGGGRRGAIIRNAERGRWKN